MGCGLSTTPLCLQIKGVTMIQHCVNHPEKEALSFCHSCGKYFCNECLVEGNEYYYCNSEKCQEELKKEIGNSSLQIKTTKKWKYGWGWAILGYLYIKQNQQITSYYGEYTNLFQLFGFIVSLSIYFLFRQKILTKINKIWLRSIVSGLIAIILTIPFIYILESTVGIKTASQDNVVNQKTVEDPNVTRILKSKLAQQKEYLYTFAQNDKSLWNQFHSEPNSTKDINDNINILNELIPLYKEKDSVLISTYSDITVAKESSDEWRKGVPNLISDFRSIVNIGSSMSIENQKYLNSLLNYYLSLKRNDNQADKYWNLYKQSYAEVQTLSNKLNPILIRISGKDLTKTLEEIEKEYYK